MACISDYRVQKTDIPDGRGQMAKQTARNKLFYYKIAKITQKEKGKGSKGREMNSREFSNTLHS